MSDPRPNVSPDTGTLSHGILKRLLAAGDIDTALAALIAGTGTMAGALRAALRWTESGRTVLAVTAEPNARSEWSVRRVSEGDLPAADAPGWESHDLGIRGGEQGTLFLQGADLRGAPEFPVLLAAAATTLAALWGRHRLSVQESRYSRWFETMDAQIRVLERERQKLAALVNKSEAGAMVIGTDYHIRWVNPAVASGFGSHPAQSLIGGHCNRLCGRAEGVCGSCPVHAVLESGDVSHQERTEAVDGSTRHFYVSAFPVRTPQAEIEEVLVTIQDLTDLETLRRSESRYQMLFERSPDSIVLADTSTLQVLMANPRARALTGMTGETPGNLLDLHPETSRERMARAYRRLAEGRPLENEEMEVIAADRSIVTCNAFGTLFDLDGQTVILIEYRDVTQIRKLQAELARADHLITLGTMNAGIAHEFKNRLAPLRAFAQLLTLGGGDEHRVQTFSPLVIQEVDRLTGLVRDVLDYARPHQPDCRTLDLAEVAARLAAELDEEYGEQLQAQGTRLIVESPPAAKLPVRSDPDQIRRAFINIFRNCLEACDNVEKESEIRLAVEQRRQSGVIRFTDTGIGIRAEDLGRIFDPFFTTKGTRGTGLGMCIVKSLIEANGGTIGVNSEGGAGTTVEVVFPLVDASELPGRAA